MTIGEVISNWSLSNLSPRNVRRSKKTSMEKDNRCAPSSSGDVNARDTQGRTLLFYAAKYDQPEVVKSLLEAGCDPNTADKEGNTPLQEATEKGNISIIKMLVINGDCDVNARNRQGRTPLMTAAFFDLVDVLKVLHKAGAHINEVDRTGKSALLIGLGQGSQRSCIYLIRHGCDVNIVDREGISALYLAMHSSSKNLEFAKKLVKAGYNVSKDARWLIGEERQKLFNQDDKFYNLIVEKVRESYELPHDVDKDTASLSLKMLEWSR